MVIFLRNWFENYCTRFDQVAVARPVAEHSMQVARGGPIKVVYTDQFLIRTRERPTLIDFISQPTFRNATDSSPNVEWDWFAPSFQRQEKKHVTAAARTPNGWETYGGDNNEHTKIRYLDHIIVITMRIYNTSGRPRLSY